MTVMLTTGEVAALLNRWAHAPGGYTSDFVLGEIDDARLVARVNVRSGGSRRRRRIRVHLDDVLVYVRTHHPTLVRQVRSELRVTGGGSQ